MSGSDEAPGRIAAALAKEEQRGLAFAIRGRLLALAAIELWLLAAIHERWALFFHLWLAALGLLGVLQLWLLGRGYYARLRFAFAALDGILLAFILLAPNPLLSVQPPPALVLRYANIVFVFVLLAGAALSYSPALVLWTGLSAVAAWGVGLWLLSHQPGIITSADPAWQAATGMDQLVALFLQPNFIHLNIELKLAFVVLLVSALLAVAVARARRLVLQQVAATRARLNLERYFSPNLVEALTGRDEPLRTVRRQPVAVLFVDIHKFTSYCEQLTPEAVVGFLRDFHQRMANAVFAHAGTLDKYTGDGLMATFGTPEPGPRDASNALACARRMIVELAELNQLRLADGLAPIELGIGIHYGPVVQGDIGSSRRLEFTVLGDTVNVAARLENLTRELATRLVVSDDLVAQLRRESAAPDLAGLTEAAPHPIRGRAGRLAIWTLSKTSADSAPEPVASQRA